MAVGRRDVVVCPGRLAGCTNELAERATQVADCPNQLADCANEVVDRPDRLAGCHGAMGSCHERPFNERRIVAAGQRPVPGRVRTLATC
jgi:hypothetical protein